MIREAIDLRFESDFAIRAEAIRSLLDETSEPVGVEPDWAETKAMMDRELEEKLDL